MTYEAAVVQAASLPDDTLGSADIDLGALAAAKVDFDVVGHYARPDVFQLHVDVGNKRAVSAIGAEKGNGR